MAIHFVNREINRADMSINTIEEIIEDFRQGRMVIIMDDEDRENEGDLIMAAAKVRPQDINFMAQFARGLVCLTLTKDRCQRLNLPLMVNANNSQHSTNFTVSIEAAQGVTTGISAADRAATVRAAVAPEASAQDLVQPGHIFPIMAQPGGVLTRAGHTEAGCDLARLANLDPYAVIVEVLNPDGSMARRPDLEQFAKTHDLKIGTIADLIRYRIENEKTVERVSDCKVETEFGEFNLYTYIDNIDNELHFALVKGDINGDKPVLVRVHLQNTLCDWLSIKRPECGWPLRKVMQKIAQADCGVLVMLQKQEDKREIISKICNYYNVNCETKPENVKPKTELRTLGAGSQILGDLGVRKMRVMSVPRVMHGLSGFDLEIVEYVNEDQE